MMGVREEGADGSEKPRFVLPHEIRDEVYEVAKANFPPLVVFLRIVNDG